jgi:hypothetical protein
MALASGYSVTVSSATQSDHLSLPPGEWVLDFASAGAFVLDVQRGLSGASFRDVFMSATDKAVMDSVNGPSHLVVVGAGDYRMDVTTYNNPITMTATRSGC